MKDPILFGDYSNALDETEPRVYKDIIDYDASKALFQVLQLFDCDTVVDPQFFSYLRCHSKIMTLINFPGEHDFFYAANR